MEIISLNINDLKNIGEVQPEDWPDITPSIRFYIESDYCYPIKVVKANKIIGVGSTIIFNNTAWLAHIIVHQEFRNQGVGKEIVNSQLDFLKSKKIPTIQLIATKLGEPVYRKVGFRNVTEYIFLNKKSEVPIFPNSPYITPFSDKYKNEILEMDKLFSGEDRSPLILNNLSGSLLYIYENEVLGYYLPSLGEGHIIAIDKAAGIELLKKKYISSDRIVIPKENIEAYKLLTNNGFSESLRCSRMIYGKEISWRPECLYSRIGGNLG